MAYDVIVCSAVLCCPNRLMLMVGMHRLDCRNDVDPAVTVDQQYTVHEQFPFLNFELADGNITK